MKKTSFFIETDDLDDADEELQAALALSLQETLTSATAATTATTTTATVAHVPSGFAGGGWGGGAPTTTAPNSSIPAAITTTTTTTSAFATAPSNEAKQFSPYKYHSDINHGSSRTGNAVIPAPLARQDPDYTNRNSNATYIPSSSSFAALEKNSTKKPPPLPMVVSITSPSAATNTTTTAYNHHQQQQRSNTDYPQIPYDPLEFHAIMWDASYTTDSDKLRWIQQAIQNDYLVLADAKEASVHDDNDNQGTTTSTSSYQNKTLDRPPNPSSGTPTPSTMLEVLVSSSSLSSSLQQQHKNWGLVQHYGGPCGVLAAVQAELVRLLLFSDNDDNHGDNDHDMQVDQDKEAQLLQQGKSPPTAKQPSQAHGQESSEVRSHDRGGGGGSDSGTDDRVPKETSHHQPKLKPHEDALTPSMLRQKLALAMGYILARAALMPEATTSTAAANTTATTTTVTTTLTNQQMSDKNDHLSAFSSSNTSNAMMMEEDDKDDPISGAAAVAAAPKIPSSVPVVSSSSTSSAAIMVRVVLPTNRNNQKAGLDWSDLEPWDAAATSSNSIGALSPLACYTVIDTINNHTNTSTAALSNRNNNNNNLSGRGTSSTATVSTSTTVLNHDNEDAATASSKRHKFVVDSSTTTATTTTGTSTASNTAENERNVRSASPFSTKCFTNGREYERQLQRLARVVASFLLNPDSQQLQKQPPQQWEDDKLPPHDTTSAQAATAASCPLECFLRPGGVLLLTMSVVATRGASVIARESDDPDRSRLTSQFGHCSQELINLLLTGQAVSNVFDHTMEVATIVCRGISQRPHVGYLSQLEALRYCQVGEYYKTPLYPVWVVGSTSHFSVLFGSQDALKESQSDLLLEKCRLAFKRCEKEECGFIETQQLSQVLQQVDLQYEDHTIQMLAATLEVAGAGIILWDDFWKTVSRLLTGASLESVLQGCGGGDGRAGSDSARSDDSLPMLVPVEVDGRTSSNSNASHNMSYIESDEDLARRLTSEEAALLGGGTGAASSGGGMLSTLSQAAARVGSPMEVEPEAPATSTSILSDEALARKLQAEYDAEVAAANRNMTQHMMIHNGPNTTGAQSSNDSNSVAAVHANSPGGLTLSDNDDGSSDHEHDNALALLPPTPPPAYRYHQSNQQQPPPPPPPLLLQQFPSNPQQQLEDSKPPAKRKQEFEQYGDTFFLYHYNGLRGGVLTPFRVTRLTAEEAVGASIALHRSHLTSAAPSRNSAVGEGIIGHATDLEDVVRTRWPSCMIDWLGKASPHID